MGETNKTYSAKLVSATRELSAKERVAVKMFIGAEQLDELTQRDENGVLIDIDYVAVVEVYNEKSDNKNYNKYVYVDKNGTMYISGSETLYRTYEEIAEEMEEKLSSGLAQAKQKKDVKPAPPSDQCRCALFP